MTFIFTNMLKPPLKTMDNNIQNLYWLILKLRWKMAARKEKMLGRSVIVIQDAGGDVFEKEVSTVFTCFLYPYLVNKC